MCLLDEVAGVEGDDWATMMRVLLQVSLRAAHVQTNNFAILTIGQCTSHCLEPNARWELKRMAKQLLPLTTQVNVSGLRVQGQGFRVKGSGFRVQG